MENSMLNKISQFIKDNNITIETAYFKITDDFLNRFSPAFYETIIKYMKLANSYYTDTNIDDAFLIKIDKNKNVYLEFLGADKHTKIIVIQDFIQYDNLPPSRIVFETDFLNTIKSIDTQNNLKILEYLNVNFKKRFIKETQNVITIEKVLEHMANEFISYIYYLEKEKQLNIEKIYFTETESNNITTKKKKFRS